jgi:hypothetical protein
MFRPLKHRNRALLNFALAHVPIAQGAGLRGLKGQIKHVYVQPDNLPRRKHILK